VPGRRWRARHSRVQAVNPAPVRDWPRSRSRRRWWRGRRMPAQGRRSSDWLAMSRRPFLPSGRGVGTRTDAKTSSRCGSVGVGHPSPRRGLRGCYQPATTMLSSRRTGGGIRHRSYVPDSCEVTRRWTHIGLPPSDRLAVGPEWVGVPCRVDRRKLGYPSRHAVQCGRKMDNGSRRRPHRKPWPGGSCVAVLPLDRRRRTPVGASATSERVAGRADGPSGLPPHDPGRTGHPVGADAAGEAASWK